MGACWGGYDSEGRETEANSEGERVSDFLFTLLGMESWVSQKIGDRETSASASRERKVE